MNGEWELRLVCNSSLMLPLHPHTLLHPVWHSSYWIVLDEPLPHGSIPPNADLGKDCSTASSCWKTCGLPFVGRGSRSLLWHVLSMAAASSTGCHMEMSSTVVFNMVCRGISSPACGAPPCPPPSLTLGSAVLFLTLCSHCPLTFCRAVALCFSKNMLYQRCHPIASISPQEHTALRNEQIKKTKP